MRIFGRADSDSCPQGFDNCQPSYALTGTDPTGKEDDSTYGPVNYGKPGPHRFIGIGMVAGMVFLGLTVYLIFGRRPKQLRREYCRCLGGRKNEAEEAETGMKQVSVMLETSSAESYSPEEKPGVSRPSGSIAVMKGDTDVRSKSHQKRSSRSRSRAKHRSDGGRHVGGSVGHVAKDVQDVDEQPGNLVTGWKVEHKGVRYEARTPVDDQTDQKLEVHLQKPALAYQR